MINFVYQIIGIQNLELNVKSVTSTVLKKNNVCINTFSHFQIYMSKMETMHGGTKINLDHSFLTHQI